MMKIEIAVDAEEAQEFMQYLQAQGHDVKIGRSTGSYIDGVSTSTDPDTNEKMNSLWNEYCSQ